MRERSWNQTEQRVMLIQRMRSEAGRVHVAVHLLRYKSSRIGSLRGQVMARTLVFAARVPRIGRKKREDRLGVNS